MVDVMPSSSQRSRTAWTAVSCEVLEGRDLAPYVPGEITNLFDWAENPHGGSVHRMPHRGQFLVDVVAIETNAVHQPSKPGDELVVVLNGTLTLTTDATGGELVVETGESVLIPAGWAGIYRVSSAGPEPFRELAIVPGNYFDPGAAPPANSSTPRRLDLPRAAGRHELHRNRYTLEAQNGAAADMPVGGATDEIILVLDGALTLRGTERTASFGRGGVVILPASVTGLADCSSDYRAINARWLG